MNELSLYERVPPLKNNFTVKFMEFHRPGDLLPHWHEHLELLYFTGGECELIIGGRRISARPGDLAVVNSSEVHSFKVDGEVSYYCVLIYPDFFSDVDFRGVRLQNIIKSDAYVNDCFRNMSAEHRAPAPSLDSRLMLKSQTYSLMAYLVRLFTDSTESDEEMGRNRAMLDRFSRVSDYVATNYTQEISTADLAAMCFLSESHFCRFFKKMTGKSAIAYVNEYRIERAAAMLAGTSATIVEIANSVGISDPNYFTRIFTRIKGKSPREFRHDVQTSINN